MQNRVFILGLRVAYIIRNKTCSITFQVLFQIGSTLPTNINILNNNHIHKRLTATPSPEFFFFQFKATLYTCS